MEAEPSEVILLEKTKAFETALGSLGLQQNQINTLRELSVGTPMSALESAGMATTWRWMTGDRPQDKLFQEAYSLLTAFKFKTLALMSVGMAQDAMRVQHEIMMDEGNTAHVRSGTAKHIIDQSKELYEMAEILRRLELLEEES